METNPVSFQKLIGQEILIKFVEYKQGKVLTVTLIGHEPGGVWIESKDFMEDFFQGTPHTMSLGSLQYFVPFHRIVAIYRLGDTPWISERVAR